MPNQFYKTIFFALLLTTVLTSYFFRLKKFRPFTPVSEIYSDRAGYYIYLPCLFIYDFKSNSTIEKYTPLTLGFSTKDGKIVTKYPYGTSLLISPFWLTGHLFHKTGDGFNEFCHKIINVSGLSYYLLSILLIRKILSIYFNNKEFCYKILILVTFGSNLFYFGSIDLGMSHIYSFFSVSLFVLNWLKFLNNKRYKHLFISALSLGLTLAIRQIDFVFLSIFLLWNVNDWQTFKERFNLLIKPLHVFTFLFGLLLLIAPQLYFNQQMYQSFKMDSYEGEGFIYFLNPKIIEVLFSIKSGIFVYAPFLAFSLLFFFKPKDYYSVNKNTLTFSLFIVLFVYSYASWWCYNLGISFGYRVLVNFFPLLILPAAHYLWKVKHQIKYDVIILLMVFYMLNLGASNLGKTYISDDNWNWSEYFHLLTQPAQLIIQTIKKLFH